MLATGALGLLLAPAHLYAQARDTARVAPVVITATRSPLPQESVPVAVTVLQGDALRARGITQLTDALKLVPGVSVAQAGSFGSQASVFIRGGQSNYTKVLVNGVAVNDPGGGFDFGTLTLDDVERIEVVRGPASVLWGSDAVSGVINIITRGGGSEGVEATVRGGTFGTMDFSASARGGAGVTLYSVGGGHHSSNGIYDLNNHYRSDAGNGTLALSPWSGGQLRFTGRYSDLDAHYPTNSNGDRVDSNAFRTEKLTVLGMEVGQRIGADVDATLLLNSSLRDGTVVNPADSAMDLSALDVNHIRRQSAELRVSTPLGTGASVSAGAMLEQQLQHTSYSSTAPGPSGPVQSTTAATDRRDRQAVYVQLLSTAAGATATFGARLDRSAVSGDFFTYRVAVSRKLASATTLRAGIGTGFREPAFYESTDSPYSTANPDLRPERTSGWEAGIQQGFAGERLTLGATYFHQLFTDLIDARYTSTTATYENVARARSSGVEVQLDAQPARQVGLQASYTYLDARVLSTGLGSSSYTGLAEGSRLLRRPPQSASASITYSPAAGASVSFHAAYVGARDDRRFHGPPTYAVDNVTLEPYTKLDLSAELPLRTGVIATLRLDNLTNTYFEPVAAYPAAGRAIYAGARLRF